MKRTLLPLLLVLAVTTLTISTSFATIHTVLADNFFYSPDMLTISEGDTVEFVRVAGNHPTSSSSGDWAAPFSGMPLNSGMPSFQLVFPDAGTYDYFCDFHVGLGMVGTITVEAGCGPTTVPTGFAATVTSAAIQFSWDPVATSVGCRLSGGPVGAGFPAARNIPGFELSGANIPTSSLSPGNYEARVQCACSLSPLVLTSVSASATFTLPEARLAAATELTLSPNPTSNFSTLKFEMTEAGAYEILITDGSGRLVQQIAAEAATGFQTHQLDLSDLAKGTYFVQLNASGVESTNQLTVIR